LKAGGGYTFHQHYDKLGLINMNGRVYDPIVGRFLSVDPLVGNPLSAQDYNGYSYCANNPMKYTDPSGYTYKQFMDDHYESYFYRGGIMNGGTFYRQSFSGGGAYTRGPAPGFNVSALAGTAGYTYVGDKYIDRATGNTVSWGDVKTNYVERVAGRYVPIDYFQMTSMDGGKTWGNVKHVGTDWVLEKVQAVASNAPAGQGGVKPRLVLDDDWYRRASGRCDADYTIEKAFVGGYIGTRGILALIDFVRTVTTPAKTESVFTVTKDGVVLPKGARIPDEFVQNPYRSSNYGIIENGNYVEKVRIDYGTPPGFKGPNDSHFHLDNGKHIFDPTRWPWY